MTTAQLFSETILIYVPAMVANMAPIFAHRAGFLLLLNIPLNIRLLGANKTVRGFVAGVCAGAITGALLFLITTMSPYETLSRAIAFGAATGLGALVGDSVKSFFKRRLNIASGTSWIPFDQIDFVLGATLFGLFFIHIPFIVVTFALVAIGFASYIVSVVGVALHIKQSL